MNTSNTKRTALIGASILTAVLAAGCGEATDRPEIKQCRDAGGIAIRSVWDATMLSECVFPPEDKAANAALTGGEAVRVEGIVIRGGNNETE